MAQNELGDKFQNFHFKFAEPHEHETILKLFEKYLYPALKPAGYNPEYASDWTALYRVKLRNSQDLTYLAIDSETGEIAAVRVVTLIKKDEPSNPLPFQYQPHIDYKNVSVEMTKDINLFEMYGVTEYPNMCGLCVHEKYRQRGLGTEMYKRGLAFLKARGFKIVECGFLGDYARRAGLKFGYKEFAKRRYLDFRGQNGEILNPKAGPEEFACCGIFDLRD